MKRPITLKESGSDVKELPPKKISGQENFFGRKFSVFQRINKSFFVPHHRKR
jgi:hypothetical protein